MGECGESRRRYIRKKITFPCPVQKSVNYKKGGKRWTVFTAASDFFLTTFYPHQLKPLCSDDNIL
jgi:hypothetical protein